MRGSNSNQMQGKSKSEAKQNSTSDRLEALEGKWAAQEARWAAREEKWEAREEKWDAKAEQFADNPEKLAALEEKWDSIRENWDEKREQWDEKREEWDEIREEISSASEGGVSYDAESNTYSVPTGTPAAEVNTIIVGATAGATIVLLDGVHEFSETIQINRDDISIEGESEEGTILNFTFPEGTGANAIEISSGAEKAKFSELTESVEAGATEITIADASSLSAGDVIYISQANTEEYLAENGWDNVSFEDADNRPFREMIIRVEAVEGNTITLSSPLAFDFDAMEADIFNIEMLENVSLENFTVTSGLDAETNYNDFVNTYPEFDKTSVIYVEGVDGMELSGITIIDTPSTAFDFRSTIDLTGDNLYVNGAHNLGGGGNGYGFQLYETFDASLTDLEIYNVRHSVLFSSWHAEAGNYIEIASTNRDVNFHGSPDIGNTVIVGTSILEYSPDQHTGSGNGFWSIVSGGGSRHAGIDYDDENSVVFTHAEGSTGRDTIYGADGGSYFDGNGSQDILIGGNGDDTIIGGLSRDLLTGGEGADIFVFEVGDSFDVITDFSGDEEGDTIWFTGEHDLVTFEDLDISQNGEDTDIVYGGSSKITLANYDMAALEAGFFVFEPEDLASYLV